MAFLTRIHKLRLIVGSAPHRSLTTTTPTTAIMSKRTPPSSTTRRPHSADRPPPAYIVVFKDHATEAQINSYSDKVNQNGTPLVLRKTGS